MNINFTAIAPMVLNFILRNVFLLKRIRKGMSESLSFINAIFAVSIAVSLPAAPIAIPTVLCANAGASFMPSPTIATYLSCLKITLVVSLLFLAGQFVFGTSFSIARSQNINVYGGLSTRYPSFFQDPQKYAQFLAAISFLFLIKDRYTAKVPLSNYFLLLCTLVAIMFTGGRAAFGGWCVGVLIILVFGEAKNRTATIFVATFLFVIVYNFSESFAMFQRADLTESYEFRYAIWQDAFGIFKEHPLFGIGIGNYANYVSVHNPDQYWLAENEFTYFDHPESGYLKFLTEAGAAGFLLILFFIFFPILKGFKRYLKNNDTTILLLIAALTSWMIGFYTVYSSIAAPKW